MQNIINLLDKKRNLDGEIMRLQNQIKTIDEDIKNFISNLTPTKKRFLDDKILSTFSEEKLKIIYSYREYNKNLSEGVCNAYVAWDDVFDPYIDKYTISIINVDNRDDGLYIMVSVTPEKPSGNISCLMTFYNIYTTDWFNLEEFENCE